MSALVRRGVAAPNGCLCLEQAILAVVSFVEAGKPEEIALRHQVHVVALWWRDVGWHQDAKRKGIKRRQVLERVESQGRSATWPTTVACWKRYWVEATLKGAADELAMVVCLFIGIVYVCMYK